MVSKTFALSPYGVPGGEQYPGWREGLPMILGSRRPHGSHGGNSEALIEES